MNYRAKGHAVADTLKRRDGILSLECVALKVNLAFVVDSSVHSVHAIAHISGCDPRLACAITLKRCPSNKTHSLGSL